MTRRTSRNQTDLRATSFEHRGNTVTVRLVNPEASADGRHIRPDAGTIHEHTSGREVIVRGWLIPSTFEATGIGKLVVRFTLLPSNPLTLVPLVIGAMEIENPGPYRPAWNTADIPIRKIERAAITVSTVWIRRRPGPPMPDGTRIRMWSEEHRRWIGTNEVISLANALTQYDLDRLRGKTPSGRPPWDSHQALALVARHYQAAKSDESRIVTIEQYIGALTFTPAGTVRRQITEARRRGYIASDQRKRRRKR
jgi:hypothetical protein